MTSRIGSFRLIFAIREISDQVKPGSYFRITVGDDTKFSKIPFKEALVIDLNTVGSEAVIEFTLENETGEIFGYSELQIPIEIFDKQETEVNETIKLYLNTEGESNSATAKVYLVFLNKNLFKDKNKPKSVGFSSANNTPPPTRPTPNVSSSIPEKDNATFNSTPKQEAPAKKPKLNSTFDRNNRLNSASGTSASASAKNFNKTSPISKSVLAGPSPNKIGTLGRSKSKTEENFSQYLNQLVEKHTSEIEKLSDLSPYVKKNPESQRVSPKIELGSSQKFADALEGNPKSSDSALTFSPDKARKYESRPYDSNKYDSNKYDSAQQSDGFRADSPSKKSLEPHTNLDKANAQIYHQKAEIEHLKNIIHSLDTRLKQFDLVRNENEIYKSNLAKAEESRKDLQNSILETTNELKQEQSSQLRQLQEALREKELIVARNEELMNKIDDLGQRLLKCQAALDKRNIESRELEVKASQMDQMQKHIERIENSLAITESKRAEDQQAFINSLKSYEKSLEDTKLLIGTYSQEKKDLIRELSDVKAQLAREQAEQTDTQRAYSLTLKRLENSEKQKDVILALQNQREDLKRQLSDAEAYHNDLKALVESTKEELMIKTREFDNNERKYLKEIAALREKLNQADVKENNYIQQTQIAKATISELKANVSGLEQILCIKEDVNKQLDSLTMKLANTTKDREALNAQVQALLQSQTFGNSKVLELEAEIFNLKNNLADKEEYILTLKKLIIEIKEKQVLYIPKKDDKIDIALADYVNMQSDPGLLRALLLRENEGVYQFGTKKVYMKLEAEKLYVRVGGGYVIIDEFLDQFLPIELEKIDPVKLLGQKVSLEKTMPKGRSASQNLSPVSKK